MCETGEKPVSLLLLDMRVNCLGVNDMIRWIDRGNVGTRPNGIVRRVKSAMLS